MWHVRSTLHPCVHDHSRVQKEDGIISIEGANPKVVAQAPPVSAGPKAIVNSKANQSPGAEKQKTKAIKKKRKRLSESDNSKKKKRKKKTKSKDKIKK